MLLLNSLEDRDNPKRVIFSVDKLNEGWDVLNLFDIVRLKNKASQKDTTKDAQLIGREARYYPFSYNDFKPSCIEFYQRKFDFSNPLSALERLDYHAIYNSEFIAQLNKELQDLGLGLIEKEKTTISLTPTKRFKCYYASNTKDKKKNLFNMDYSDPIEVKLQSLHVPLFAFDVREKKVDFKEENKGDRTYYMPYTLNKIPINYFLKALNLKNLNFKTLKKAFKKHAFNNKVEFIKQYISHLKTNFHKSQKFDNNEILLKLAVYIIENLKDTLLKEQDKYEVSALELKEFETHERSLSASEWEKDIPFYEWLLFKDMRKLDSDLERDFLDFINKNKEILDKKFKEWCVLRNDHFAELKVFCDIENSPYPRNFYVQNTIEFIGVFVKDGKPKQPTEEQKEQSQLAQEEWVEFTKQIWEIPIPNKNDIAFGKHAALMPAELARRLIRLYSCVGDVVLDPFSGSGTTLREAKLLKRNFIGYELYENYKPLIEQKLGNLFDFE